MISADPALLPFDPLLCALCGGALRFLGALGELLHYRCRNCGGEFSRAADLQKTRAAIARAIDRGNE